MGIADKITEKIPLIGRKKKQVVADDDMVMVEEEPRKARSRGGSNGHISQEDLVAIQEMVVQTIDARMPSYMTQQNNVNSEEYKDLRKFLFETPKSKKRELTIRTEKEVALHPWLYMLAYMIRPEEFKDKSEGKWGQSILDREGNVVGHTRRPGDLLPFLIGKIEEINRSKKGFMVTHTVGLTKMQVEEEYESKHLSSPGG